MPGENQNPDNPMDIAEKLKQYLETLATRGLSGALNPGATEADLKNFESEHGIRLPEALADVYRAFNGQIHDRIPPANRAGWRWTNLRQQQDGANSANLLRQPLAASAPAAH